MFIPCCLLTGRSWTQENLTSTSILRSVLTPAAVQRSTWWEQKWAVTRRTSSFLPLRRSVVGSNVSATIFTWSKLFFAHRHSIRTHHLNNSSSLLWETSIKRWIKSLLVYMNEMTIGRFGRCDSWCVCLIFPRCRLCFSERSSIFVSGHIRRDLGVGHGDRRWWARARMLSFGWRCCPSGRLDLCFLCLWAEASVVFWHAVKEVGLLDEVVEEFQNELQEVLKGLHERVCDPPLQVKGQGHLRYVIIGMIISIFILIQHRKCDDWDVTGLKWSVSVVIEAVSQKRAH